MGARRRAAVGASSPTTWPTASCASSAAARRRPTRSRSSTTSAARRAGCATLSDDLPFDFNCGFVGYLGYELKAECGGGRAHASSMPDAAFVFADRLIAFDHVEQTHVPAVRRGARGRLSDGERWIRETSRAARRAAARRSARTGSSCRPRARTGPWPSASAARTEQYLDDIARCKQRADRRRDLRDLPHEQGRRRRCGPTRCRSTARCAASTPRPFSAFLRFGDSAVLSSSPERFLVDRPRPLGGGEADQGHVPPRRDAGRGRAPGGGAALRREDARREPDDRRPAAQRPRRRLRGRHRARADPDARRDLRDRPPARLHRARRCCARTSSRPTACAPASRAVR